MAAPSERPPSRKGCVRLRLEFEADYQIDAQDAAEAEAVAREALDDRPGDWAVRFFWAVEFETYGIRVRSQDRGIVELFDAAPTQAGLRDAVRSALEAAVAKIERSAESETRAS